MKRKLKIERILIYHDFPELFLAKDRSGLNYLCLLTSFEEESYSYHCVGISLDRLLYFLNGRLDLRDVFSSPEMSEWWITEDTSESEFEITFCSDVMLSEDYLPESGFFYLDEIQEEEIRNEALEYNNVVIHLSLSDKENRQSIPINDLGDFAKLYQGLVTNAFRKSLINYDIDGNGGFMHPQNYTLEAVAASPGSFNLHLISRSYIDLYGHSILERGLTLIDNIILNTESDEELIDALKQIKGHALSNYKNILDRIISKNITFKYKWNSPSSPVIHSRVIDKAYAKRVNEVLNSKTELIDETREFIGYVKQADVAKGSWRITNEEDGKDYSGKSESNILEGVTLKTIRYKFVCKEVINEMKVSGKEKVEYYLRTVEKLD